ncbi:MAG: hypothetical protein K2G23_04935, partial [Muribaculaceae bacterium]|nr:hypothetical protein [Muribaculaceae bacterium]
MPIKAPLPQGFIDEMQALLPEDADLLFDSLAEEPTVSIKLNRRKTSDPAITGYTELETVPWCESGYYLPARPKFTINPLLHAGAFYVQEASSMVYETIVSRIIPMSFDT